MRLVIADTGPINYLLLIQHIDILPSLFDRVVLPAAVKDELSDPETPPAVRDWIANAPAWVEVHESIPLIEDSSLKRLDPGEGEAIRLALELKADLLLIDDRAGVAVAENKGLRVAGTLGVLGMAARHGIINLAEAFERLKRTNFHYRQELLDRLLDETSGRR